MKAQRVLAVIFGLVLAAPLSASPFSLDPLGDTLVMGGSLAVNLIALGDLTTPESEAPAWERVGFPFSPSADLASKALAFGALATPAVLVTTPTDQWLTLGVLYTESLSWAWGLKELGKHLVRRTRPSGEEDDSFPSGHTTLAFTGAAFTSFVFDRCFPDSSWTLPLTLGSYSLATGTASSG